MMEQIVVYIQTQRQAGFNDQLIHAELLKAGWPIEQVEQAFTVLNPNPMPPPKQKKQMSLGMLLAIAFGLLIVTGVFTYMFMQTSGDGDPIGSSQNDQPLAEIEDDQQTEPVDEFEDIPSEPANSQAIVSKQNAVNQLLAYAEMFAADNNGQYPASSSTLIDDLGQFFINDPLVDPDTGERYLFTSVNPAIGELQYSVGSACSDSNLLTSAGGRDIAVRVLLSEDNYYCQDNG